MTILAGAVGGALLFLVILVNGMIAFAGTGKPSYTFFAMFGFTAAMGADFASFMVNNRDLKMSIAFGIVNLLFLGPPRRWPGRIYRKIKGEKLA